MTDVVEVLVETSPVVVEVPVATVDVVEVLGTPRPPRVAAEGVVTVPAIVWVMIHRLGYHPAGWRFTDENGAPLQPVRVVDVSTSISTAEWLDDHPVRGSWIAS